MRCWHSSYSFRLGLCASTAFLLMGSGLAHGQVDVTGFTYELRGDDYKTLADVEIQAFRKRSPIFPRPEKSKADGSFRVTVPGSQPFQLVFFSPTKLPDMYVLAGKSGTKNELHVTVICQGAR